MALELVLTEESPQSQSVQPLIRAMAAEIGPLYGNPDPIGFKSPVPLKPESFFLVAWLEGDAVGCVALQPLAPAVGEVKRMFVSRGQRGRGIAWRLLAELERAAHARGYRHLRLETGLLQPEAIRLYLRAGFLPAPCGDLYIDEQSVCFEKTLAAPS